MPYPWLSEEKTLPPSLSIYLDGLRVFATLWVAIAHLGSWSVVDPKISD